MENSGKGTHLYIRITRKLVFFSRNLEKQFFRQQIFFFVVCMHITTYIDTIQNDRKLRNLAFLHLIK